MASVENRWAPVFPAGQRDRNTFRTCPNSDPEAVSQELRFPDSCWGSSGHSSGAEPPADRLGRNAHPQEVALFRYGVIGDLVHLPPGAKGLYQRLKEKADIDYRIPGSLRVRVAPETIRGWLSA